MDLSVLDEIGMTPAEIKVYLALLDLGTSNAGPIVKRSGLQNSVVHLILPKLEEKGFVKFITKGGIREYSAASPEQILKFINDKKEKFEKLLPQLLFRQKSNVEQMAEIFQGFKGLKVALNELLKDSKKGDEFLFFVFEVNNVGDYEKVYEFYRKDFHEQRKEIGLVEKGISPLRLKNEISKASWAKKCVKFIDFPTLTNISILNNKVLFTPWEDGETSFLVNSKQMADSFRKHFYSIWDKK